MSLPTGPILPSQGLLNEYEHGKFVLTNLAAKRAKQLKDGAPPLVRMESSHPLTIALAEIAAGKIKPIIGLEEREPAVTDGADLPILSDEPLPSELGMLLPALDDTEVELVTSLGAAGVVGDAEDEVEPVATLGDLLDEPELEPEPIVSEGDENEISLTDIADQEMIDEEEDSVD